jgi:DnaK suppressor protein
MKKERLASFKKQLLEKHQQLAAETGRTALYATADQEDAAIKDLGDQANAAYTREFFFELGNGDRRVLRDVVAALQKIDDGSFGNCERCGEPIADKRLEALPFARYCIDCQRLVEQEERSVIG